MCRVNESIIAVSMLSLSLMLCACATVQPENRQAKIVTGIDAGPGDAVFLYYGTSSIARDEFCPNAIAPVYRITDTWARTKSEVGKVRVTRDLGNHYLEAVVVEGELNSNDIALQSNSACLTKLSRTGTE